MFYRLGLKIVARARVVLAMSVVALVISAALGVGAFARLLSGGFDDPASASSQAKVLLDQKFGGEPDLIFLVHARTGTVDGTAVTAAGQALAHRLSADARLRGVTSYWTTQAPGLRSRDSTDALILAKVIGDEQTADTNAKALLADYAHLDSPDATVRIGGARGTDVAGQVGKDLAVAEAIAVPITVVLMIIVFGSLVASLLPLAIGVLAIFATFAELDLLTHVTSVSVFAINLATGLGLGLGMDYALLMVSRFREELAKGVDVGDAVARTMATAGRTIAFSALAVAAALSAMLVFPVSFLKSFAYAGVGVTVFSAASALLVLPALLAVLGRRVNSGRIRGIRAVRSVEAPFWGRLAGGVMRRPIVAALPVIGVLLFLATPLLSVTFGTPDERVLPTSAASHEVGDALRNDFATTPDVIDVLITPALSPSELQGYTQQLSHLSGVQRADITIGTAGAGQPISQRVSLSTGLDASSGAAQDLVRQVRAVSAPAGTTVLIGGATATLIDAKQAISSYLLLAGALIVVTTFTLLFLFTGSILQPIRALLGNTLTLGATLGAMVWIFQDGHFADVVGFTPRPTDTAMPVLLFCIAFGLSMDYELFVISRIKELHDAGVSNADAVTGGLARTGRIVSTLAALLAVGFFAFGSSHVSFIQLFGLGTGLAILIDATLVRGVLVPAFMRAFGERSWYAPTPLRRIHNRIGVSENPPDKATLVNA
ncbi:MMPL family transporter [Kribbella sp. NBC_01484]|uniref:MMPL family transporter n=1 Tax=Kribbella sp. NBC_01484 TaxID=2903579 RepID=UPI002E2F6A19|nr:MMPL family transporter [Kribbella sp. NBC_01484]